MVLWSFTESVFDLLTYPEGVKNNTDIVFLGRSLHTIKP